MQDYAVFKTTALTDKAGELQQSILNINDFYYFTTSAKP